MRTSIQIKRIEIFSLFKMAFMVFACLGLIGGFIAAFGFLVVGSIGLLEEDMLPLGIVGGAVGMVVIPIIAMFFYGSVGSIVASIAGTIYNVVAKFAGGVKVEIETPDTAGDSGYVDVTE